MPRMSDTMEEGVIVSWLKKEGDKVEPGDVLAEVETDKATMELESYQEGTLLYIGVKEGPVPVDGIIAIIGEPGEDYSALLDESASATPKKEEVAVESSSTASESTSTASTLEATPAAATNGNIKASPLARKIASEQGVDLGSIVGSGPEGRIVKSDVEKVTGKIDTSVSTSTATGASPITAAVLPHRENRDIPVTQMRKTIAKRLGESLFTAPHFFLTCDIDMSNAIAARKSFNDLGQGKVSFNDIVVKGCAMALRKHPMINSSWLGDKIRVNGDINIGVAVAVEDGLLVPVIHAADMKGLLEINAEVRDKATRAADKKLSLQEMEGSTFSISNLGMYDIDEFTAIINPPNSAILAVGSIRKTPVVNEKGEIVAGNQMKVTLSCDHRVIDGATGAEFLKTLKMYLENPFSMLT